MASPIITGIGLLSASLATVVFYRHIIVPGVVEDTKREGEILSLRAVDLNGDEHTDQYGASKDGREHVYIGQEDGPALRLEAYVDGLPEEERDAEREMIEARIVELGLRDWKRFL